MMGARWVGRGCVCVSQCSLYSTSSIFVQNYSCLLDEEMHIFVWLVVEDRSETASNNAVPCWRILFVKLLLYLCSYVLFSTIVLLIKSCNSCLQCESPHVRFFTLVVISRFDIDVFPCHREA